MYSIQDIKKEQHVLLFIIYRLSSVVLGDFLENL